MACHLLGRRRIPILPRALPVSPSRRTVAEARRLLAAALERIPPQLEAPQEPPGGPQSAGEGADRAEEPRSSTGGAQEGAEPRCWWRRVFGLSRTVDMRPLSGELRGQYRPLREIVAGKCLHVVLLGSEADYPPNCHASTLISSCPGRNCAGGSQLGPRGRFPGGHLSP